MLNATTTFNAEALSALYANGVELAEWGKANVPDKNLIYRNGVADQLRKLGGMAVLVCDQDDPQPRIVGQHYSKSVKLPVTCFKFTPYNQVAAYCFVRDNFHDIKIVVVSDSPIHIPYHVMYQEWSPERYAAEVERYVGYTKNERPPEGSDEWFSKDWSHDTILRKDGRIYRTGAHHRVYCEGIDDLGLPDETFKVYEDGMKAFVIETGSYANVALILGLVLRSLEAERYRRIKERERSSGVST